MSPRMLYLPLIASSALLAADKPNREIQELQRDMAQLQEEVKTLRQALEQRVEAATSQMHTMTEAMNRLNSGVAALQEQERKVVPLLAAKGSRVDQVASSLSTMQQAFTDLT